MDFIISKAKAVQLIRPRKFAIELYFDTPYYKVQTRMKMKKLKMPKVMFHLKVPLIHCDLVLNSFASILI